MSVPTILVLIAIALALVDEFRAQGQSLTGWAVILIGIALAWGQFT